MSDVTFNDTILRNQRRRIRLCDNVPHCPNCGQSYTLQLIAYIDTVPARWRCRLCRHSFEHEPEIEVPEAETI